WSRRFQESVRSCRRDARLIWHVSRTWHIREGFDIIGSRVELSAKNSGNSGAILVLFLQFRLQRTDACPRASGSSTRKVLAGARRTCVESWVQSTRAQRDTSSR